MGGACGQGAVQGEVGFVARVRASSAAIPETPIIVGRNIVVQAEDGTARLHPSLVVTTDLSRVAQELDDAEDLHRSGDHDRAAEVCAGCRDRLEQPFLPHDDSDWSRRWRQQIDELAAVETRTVGDRPFLTAYHSLPATGTLAVPMALSAGDTAVRQRELAHLVLFAALVGALLSLALSVLVGRTLAGPIGQLRRAAAAVGSGRLRVRLPQPPSGEFGQLFASFNRMVRRLRRARTQELRTARVLAWGEMARQIAHEIKNPLTPIKLSVQHLRRAYRDRRPDFGDILDDNVTQILNEIDRLTEIARAFSRYGAPAAQIGPVERVDATTVAREALTLYRSSDSAIEFRSSIEAGVPFVRARAGELKEVILNLLENSRDALEGHGSVEVRLYEAGDRIALDIVDDGPGIPESLQERIFDPHFSTRSSGTGLGLAIVRRIVESWGGTITVDSTPGAGTTMRVRMLAADDGRPPLRLHRGDGPAE